MFRRILVPLDGSLRAANVLPLAARLARASGGTLFLVRVIDLFNEVRIYSPMASTYLPEIAEQGYLQEVRTRLLREWSGKLDLQVTCAVVEGGDTAAALLRAVERPQEPDDQYTSDLLALTTHGRSGIQRWVLGSVTERVLQAGTLPYLLFTHKNLRDNGTSARTLLS